MANYLSFRNGVNGASVTKFDVQGTFQGIMLQMLSLLGPANYIDCDHMRYLDT